jgi:hypothetical protein
MAQALVVGGSATAAGVVCTLTPDIAVDSFLILLDATAVGTAALNVGVQVLNASGAYVAPTPIWGPAAAGVVNPVVVTNATAQMVSIPGGWPGVRVNIASFGTSTGTFRATIQGNVY